MVRSAECIAVGLEGNEHISAARVGSAPGEADGALLEGNPEIGVIRDGHVLPQLLHHRVSCHPELRHEALDRAVHKLVREKVGLYCVAAAVVVTCVCGVQWWCVV